MYGCRPYGRSFQAVPTKGEHNVGIVRDGPICATVDISSILAKTRSKIVNHTSYDPPSCKVNLNAFYFIFCKFYVAGRGVERENRFVLRKKCHDSDSTIVSVTPLSGSSVANIFASLMLERQTPPSLLYGTSHMSSVEPVSRKRVRSVGAA